MANAQPDGRFRAALDVTLDLPLASVGSRALAQAVDGAITTALTMLAGAASFALYGVLEAAGVEDAWAWALVVFLLAFFSIQSGYFLFFEHRWQGQTPGKRLFGLRVVTDEGAAPDFAACTIRNLLRTVDGLPGAYTVGVLFAIASERGKRLGDLAAGTVVVVEESPASHVARRWPPGFGPDEIATLEAWFARAPSLVPSRREALAARLLDALRARHPELRADASLAPADALAALFPGVA
ncbi:MAG: RDD family protein [Myxococcota bacterium]